MRRVQGLLLVACALFAAALVCGCGGGGGGGARKSPVGHFLDSTETVDIGSNGSFRLERAASAGNTSDYVITGTYTYTYTVQTVDNENEKTIGRFDLTVTGIVVDGKSVQSIKPADALGTVSVGDTCPGWWMYGNYVVTVEDRLSLYLNIPPDARPDAYYTGSDWLITVGPPTG